MMGAKEKFLNSIRILFPKLTVENTPMRKIIYNAACEYEKIRTNKLSDRELQAALDMLEEMAYYNKHNHTFSWGEVT